MLSWLSWEGGGLAASESSRKQLSGEKAGRQMGMYSALSVKCHRTRSPFARKTAWPALTLVAGPRVVSIVTLPRSTSAYSSKAGVCHSSAQPASACTCATEISPTGYGHGLQLAPPKYSLILTWSVSTTLTGADTRRTMLTAISRGDPTARARWRSLGAGVVNRGMTRLPWHS